MLTSLIAFAGLSFLIVVTPGPGMILVMRSSVVAGRREGLIVGAGAAVGSLVWAAAVAVGVATVLHRSDTVFTIIRLAGAAYLIWLGMRCLLISPQLSTREGTAGKDPVVQRPFAVGFGSAILNPKLGVFFLAVVPQFLPSHFSLLNGALLLGVVYALVAFGWLMVVALIAHVGGGFLQTSRAHSWFNRISGGALIGLSMLTCVAIMGPELL